MTVYDLIRDNMEMLQFLKTYQMPDRFDIQILDVPLQVPMRSWNAAYEAGVIVCLQFVATWKLDEIKIYLHVCAFVHLLAP